MLKFTDSTEPNAFDHWVQFYRTENFLIGSLADFVKKGIAEGDACIVIATPQHRQALEQRLTADGADLVTAKAIEQYIGLDAAATLSHFMAAGLPDREAFTEVAGSLIAHVSMGRRRVRAYGEMVALLWAEGNVNGAIELEKLWNGMGRIRDFSLFCAYPTAAVSGYAGSTPLAEVYTEHSHTVSEEAA